MTQITIFLKISLLVLSTANFASGGWFSRNDDSEATETLAKFKAMVTEVVPESFMKDDPYLLRLLKANEFDLDWAFNMVEKTVKWRKTDNNSNMLYEEFPPIITKEYPVLVNGNEDMDGRPILVFPFGRYNLRKGFLAGQKDAIARYVIRGFEVLERSIYMKRKTGNKSVTQGVAIVDLQGFNLARMAAGIVSLTIVPAVVPILEKYYRDIFYRIHLINVPKIFDAMLSLIKSFMEESTKESMNVYDSNSDFWKQELLKEITPGNMQVVYDALRFRNRTNFEEKLKEFFRSEAMVEATSETTTSYSYSTIIDQIEEEHVRDYSKVEQHVRHHHHHHYTTAALHVSTPFSSLNDSYASLNEIRNEGEDKNIQLNIKHTTTEMTNVGNNIAVEYNKPLNSRKSKARIEKHSNLSPNDSPSPDSRSSGNICAGQTTILLSLKIIMFISSINAANEM